MFPRRYSVHTILSFDVGQGRDYSLDHGRETQAALQLSTPLMTTILRLSPWLPRRGCIPPIVRLLGLTGIPRLPRRDALARGQDMTEPYPSASITSMIAMMTASESS